MTSPLSSEARKTTAAANSSDYLRPNESTVAIVLFVSFRPFAVDNRQTTLGLASLSQTPARCRYWANLVRAGILAAATLIPPVRQLRNRFRSLRYASCCRGAHLQKPLKRSDVATCRPRRRAQPLRAAPAFPHRHQGSAAPAPRRDSPVAELRPRSFADRLPNALRALVTSSGTNRPWPHTPAASPEHSERRAVPSWSEYLPAPVCRPLLRRARLPSPASR